MAFLKTSSKIEAKIQELTDKYVKLADEHLKATKKQQTFSNLSL